MRAMRQNLAWAVGRVFEPIFVLVVCPEVAALSMFEVQFLGRGQRVHASGDSRLLRPPTEPKTIPATSAGRLGWLLVLGRCYQVSDSQMV